MAVYHFSTIAINNPTPTHQQGPVGGPCPGNCQEGPGALSLGSQVLPTLQASHLQNSMAIISCAHAARLVQVKLPEDGLGGGRRVRAQQAASSPASIRPAWRRVARVGGGGGVTWDTWARVAQG